ncbi:cyclic nucleotide-binding domain-containing protein [Gloeothece verrucosa]|uniref:Putative transcriptional regulator, Crp/Fnr family n=1 Tax=Gloeothece verrucosa (strain PCC 7822) TaxID=497965 RepID=E0U658_GLOV7|nr:cyclic nucleotide-binding domain-containing protein [Gloeothece verrucosa]ADN12394.1 putative transcriptional regulator, Crp/Fnr family [Gloeothece verrucosa PCC 7822]
MKKVLFLFGELNDDDLDWIIARGQLEKISPNTILIEQDQPIDKLYILLKGQVEVLRTDQDSTQVIAKGGSGEVFGEMSFIDNLLPSATVKATENSVVLSIPCLQLADRLNQDIGFSSRFYRAITLFLSSRLRHTLKNLAYNPKEEEKEDIEPQNLPPAFLDVLPFAEARFDWLLRRVNNHI